MRALFTIIIPTEVTTLNIHAAASTAAFLSALLDGAISKQKKKIPNTTSVKIFIPQLPWKLDHIYTNSIVYTRSNDIHCKSKEHEVRETKKHKTHTDYTITVVTNWNRIEQVKNSTTDPIGKNEKKKKPWSR